MRWKKALRATSFVLLVILLLHGITWALRDRETTLSCLYSEKKNTVDMLIVGSSHVNSSYMTNLFWEENNASACNVFSWSQPMWISYYYIKEALKTQHPSVIALEMFGMTYGHSSIMPEEIDRTNYANSFSIDPGLNFLAMTQTVEKCGLDLRNYEDFLNLPRYHTRWKTFSKNYLNYNPHQAKDPLKGYGLVLGVSPQEGLDFQASEESVLPYEYSIEYLDKIVTLCKKEKIDLIFTLTPYKYNETERGIYNWIDTYAAQHEIPFLNYNGADGKRIGIDFNTDLADWGHTNYYGAQKVTQDLSNYLLLYHVFPSKSLHSNKAELDQDLNIYHRVLSVQKIMTETDFSVWLNMALSDENFALFVVDRGTSSVASKTLRLAFSNTGNSVIKDFSTAVVDGSNKKIFNTTQINFPLFGKAGTVTLDASDGVICLNQTTAPVKGDAITIVLYDKILDRPLETVYLNCSNELTLQHREFTSDIMPQYKK